MAPRIVKRKTQKEDVTKLNNQNSAIKEHRFSTDDIFTGAEIAYGLSNKFPDPNGNISPWSFTNQLKLWYNNHPDKKIMRVQHHKKKEDFLVVITIETEDHRITLDRNLPEWLWIVEYLNDDAYRLSEEIYKNNKVKVLCVQILEDA